MVAKGVKADTVMHLGLDLTVAGLCVAVAFDLVPAFWRTFGADASSQRYNTILDGAVRASRFALCDQFLVMSSLE